MSTYCLYVSNINPEVTKMQLFNTFKNIRLGHIKKVNIIMKKKADRGCNQAFIHYDLLYNTEHTKNIVHRLDSSNNADIKVMYNEPRFWKVRLSKSHFNNKSK